MGVPEPLRAETAEEVRRLAARHPDDPFAQVTLAHAELHFGDRPTGVALLTDLVKRYPENVEARQFMAVALIDQAEREPDNALSLNRQARAQLAEAYKIDDADFYTLYLIARSRQGEATYPNDNDVATWLAAHELAPQWPPLRLGAASALIAADRRAEAIVMLEPIANGPHAGSAGDAARAMIERARSGAEALTDDQVEAATDDPPKPPPTAADEDGRESVPEINR